MPAVSQLSESAYNFILVVGDSGAGKTCAMASFPGRTEVADWDGRIRGLWGHPGYTEEKLSQVHVQSFPPGTGFKKPHDWIKIRVTETKNRKCAFQNIIIDSFSSMGTDLVREGMSKTEGERILGDLEITQIQDYLYESEGIRRIVLEQGRALKCNFFLSAHIVPKYGKAPGAAKYAELEVIGEKVLGRDKISAIIPTFFDNVWEFRKNIATNPPRFECHFRNTALSRTTFRNLPDKLDWTWIPGKQEKLFYDLIKDDLPRVKKDATD